MNLDNNDAAPDGHFQAHEGLKTIERQLFAHMRESGDVRRLYNFEEVLYCVLARQFDADLAHDLSRLMVTRAIEQVIHDPDRDVSSVPYGIPRAERLAAYFEPGCPFCEAKLDHLAVDDDEEHEDDCACCDMLVADWRKQHAEALRQHAKRGPDRVRDRA